jgi:glycine/sarcosine N-methyltransferase
MYDQLSSDYDKFMDWSARLSLEIPYLEKILSDRGARRILDAACGTGMHALALAADGYEAAGVDSSPAMTAAAAAHATERTLRAEFRTAAFGCIAPSFTDESRFDAVLCLGNSLPHVSGPEGLIAALADFRELLNPGGLLILQNRNFDAVLAHRERWMDPQFHTGPEGETLFVRFYDFEPDGAILFHILTLRRAPGGEWRQSESSARLWPQRRGELMAALTEAGFAVEAAHGFVDGSAFDPARSPNLILIARRNGPPR